MKCSIVFFLLVAIDVSCPPRLNSFGVHRYDVGSGWVHSTGGNIQENYRLEVDYLDNRKQNTYTFQSDGTIILENLTNQNRYIKYRHSIKIPYGNYTVIKDREYFDVCADRGKITFSLKSYVFSETPSIIPWSYTVIIDPYGDINRDGQVNGYDLGLFFTGWGTNRETDFNSDGITNAEDLALLLLNWTAH